MLNFRRLRQDFSSNVLKEGKQLYQKEMVESAKIIQLDDTCIRLSCCVRGNFDNSYESEVEIDRVESAIIDSDCDCTYKYDCQHLAAVTFYLEKHLEQIVVSYSKEADVEGSDALEEEKKESLLRTIKEAESKLNAKTDEKLKKELLEEYIHAAKVLGKSPFFFYEEKEVLKDVELAIILQKAKEDHLSTVFQLALRLPNRSKPLNIPNIMAFVDAVKYQETIYIGNRKYLFSVASFETISKKLLKIIINHASSLDQQEANDKFATIKSDVLGEILAIAYSFEAEKEKRVGEEDEKDERFLPCLYYEGIESPLKYFPKPVKFVFNLEYLEVHQAPKLLIHPKLFLNEEHYVPLEQVDVFACSKPGVFYKDSYYRFEENITRRHLYSLQKLLEITIPEPLFGTFVENSLPELLHYAVVPDTKVLNQFTTLPFPGHLKAECDIHYLNGELEASLSFIYGKTKVPSADKSLQIDHINAFITEQGIIARQLTQEQKIINDLFQDFMFDEKQGVYVLKSEKKIVEFMTEVIPQNQDKVVFNCPENLLEKFIYNETTFTLKLSETKRIDQYEIDLKVDGHLKGVSIDQLWDCLTSKRPFIEISPHAGKKRKGSNHKILVLDLDSLAPVVQLFDELGIEVLENGKLNRPLWGLVSIDKKQFEKLPIKFSMTKKLEEIRKQMLGEKSLKAKPIPKEISAKLRNYQIEGVKWLDNLRQMHLSGILADDMGLGKTLQAIIAITQKKQEDKNALFIIVCPTSLIYNWVEEFHKFNPKMKTLPVDGTPQQRKKILKDIKKYDVVITSYTLLQKDIDFYQKIVFSYAILDEGQHIKNRNTRNAKSVKMLQAENKLILTGTPIENSLEELWSLFDFLMPGLLSSYERFVERYMRNPSKEGGRDLESLRKKASPFILRRMKKDVLKDLPPVSEIVYHCHLTESQKQLYQAYAQSAREELSQLVKKEGFEKVQIHVLATLTRLKQICCHPAIFAKEKIESGDSAKYEMLLELLQTLIDGGHKTVIFSQYTRMLGIIRDELTQKGIRFNYLDGSTKNRLNVVNSFNNDPNIPLFLVSLKAGGAGLNLTGADTVIHYDMWWNPAVENQATDRVHRIGQSKSVSSYKLVTLGTIEEKIMELQNRKKGLVKKVIDCDEDVIRKLTWEEVLELLQT